MSVQFSDAVAEISVNAMHSAESPESVCANVSIHNYVIHVVLRMLLCVANRMH